MVAPPDPIARFQSRIHDWEGVWKSIDSRSICFAQSDGWRNAIASIRLLAGAPKEYESMEMTYEDDRFAVVQEVFDMGRFDDLIADLRADRLRIDERTIRLDCPVPPAQPGGQIAPYGYTFESQPRRLARTMNYIVTDSFTLVLRGRGRQVGEFVPNEVHDHAARALFAHRRPYEGFPDVMRSLFSVKDDFELPGMMTVLTVLAPAYSKLESFEQVNGEHLSVQVLAPPDSNPSALRLNSIMRGLDGFVRRSSLEFTEENRLDTQGYARFERKVELAETPLVDLFLIYRGEHVDELRLVLPIRDTPNPRLIAHLAFDEEGAKLREYLFPEAPRASAGFETAVAWLFYFCGFGVASYGVPRAKLDNEIDLLAFVPFTKAVICVECKASEFKTDKLILLANRREKLKAALPGHDIIAAAVTHLDHATEPEQKQARALGISILTKTELQEILNMAERHASTQEVMEYVRRKMPSSLSF